jgi:hypothetical protein
MKALAPPAPDDKFYVDRPYSGHGFATLQDARCHAGVLQVNRTLNHSVRIYKNGEVVDLKRF